MKNNNTIEIILEKTLLSSVIKPYVSLKSKGNQVFLGLCPFHQEKTPSFHVNDQKGLYHCFGCKASGNAITFLSAIEHLSKKDVIERLAKNAGVELNSQSIKQYQKKKLLENTLLEINEQSAKHWQHYLLTNPDSKGMLYLKKRGLTLKTIKDFKLGYQPYDFQFLSSKINPSNDYSVEDLLKSSLFFETKDPSKPLKDRFPDRIIFPITNSRSEVIAFGTRVLDQSLPKYINTNETIIFKKKEVLYAFDKAKKSIFGQKNVYFVEGYFDVMAMHQFGFENTVATLGTAFSESHLELVQNGVDQMTFLFDGDTAGLKAAKRSVEICLQKGFTPIVVLLPEGLDPCDYLFSFGRESLEDLFLKESYTWAQFFIKPIKQESSALKQNNLIKKTLEFLKSVNILLVHEFLDLLSLTLNIPKINLEEYFLPSDNSPLPYYQAPFSKSKAPWAFNPKPNTVPSPSLVKNQKYQIKKQSEWIIIKLLFYHHELFKEYQNRLGPSFFTVPEVQEIYRWLENHQALFLQDPPLSLDEIVEKIPEHLAFFLKNHDSFYEIKDYNAPKLLDDTLNLYKLSTLKDSIKEINDLIKEAEEKDDQPELMRLIKIHHDLKKEEMNLKKQRGTNRSS